MGKSVDVGSAFGEVCVKQIAKRGQGGPDQHGWEATDSAEQVAAEADPDHRHEDAEDLRGKGDLVLRVVQIIEVEGEGEARPDIVAERVSQDESNDDQDPPAE